MKKNEIVELRVCKGRGRRYRGPERGRSCLAIGRQEIEIENRRCTQPVCRPERLYRQKHGMQHRLQQDDRYAARLI
jgi:hypothetical protein